MSRNILSLNGYDAFVENYDRNDIDENKWDGSGECECIEDVIEYILGLFSNCIQGDDDGERQKIHCSVINAMDTTLIKNLWQYIHHEILRENGDWTIP